MNYFSPKETAKRYAKGRPFFHENTINHIRKFLKIEAKLDKSLDIACGTGLSTKALLEISNNVYGTDSSEKMLEYATNKEDIHYILAKGEQQPFENNFFDLITVSSGIHWFTINEFLNEANRLLKNNCCLVIYDNFFISKMENAPEFSQWFPNIYLKKFPSPKRNNSYNWSNENLSLYNFELINQEDFLNPIEYSKDELILYFTTQSNITSAVERGNYSYQEIEDWLNKELSVFFSKQKKRIIYYGNWIKYLKQKSIDNTL